MKGELSVTESEDQSIATSSEEGAAWNAPQTGDYDFSLVPRPFKNPHWTPKPRRNKNIKQIQLEEARALTQPLQTDAVTYALLEAPPSLLPARKYCDITGLPAKYTDPKSGLRYCNAEIYATIRTLSHGVDQEYLKLRSAAIELR